MKSGSFKNLCVFIGGESIGSLCVHYDLNVSYDLPGTQHPDNLSRFLSEERSVSINSVEFVVFDKVSHNISDVVLNDKGLLKIIESKVLEEVESESIEDLVNADPVL